MSGLGDSLQPSAKGYSNSNFNMWKHPQMKMLHTERYHRSSQSKYSWLLFTLWHPWRFGIEHSLRLPPIRIPGPKQMKVPFAHRTELFESFLPVSLLSNPPSSWEEGGQGTLETHHDSLTCFTHSEDPFHMLWTELHPPKFICWSPNPLSGCIWSKEIIKVKGSRKNRVRNQYDQCLYKRRQPHACCLCQWGHREKVTIYKPGGGSSQGNG